MQRFNQRFFIISLFLISLLSLSCISAQSSSSTSIYEWRMFGRTLDNNRYYNGSVIMNSFGMLWNFTAPGEISSVPTVVNNKVYVGSEYNSIYVLNATNGTQIWNVTLANAVSYSSPASR